MIFYLDSLHPQLRRAMMYLEDELWSKAVESCERVLDMEPENPYAYLIEMMAQLRLHSEEELNNHTKSIRENSLFRKAVHFADTELAAVLNGCADAIEERLEQARREAEEAEWRLCYSKALALMKTDATEEQLAEAKDLLERIAEHQNVEEEWKICCERLEKLRNISKAKKEKESRLWTIVALGITALLVVISVVISSSNAKRAAQIEEKLPGLVFEGVSNEVTVPDDPMPIGEKVKWNYHYVFVDSDTVEATIEYTMDCGYKTIYFGDKHKTYSSGVRDYTYKVSDVHVSLAGKVTLHIGSTLFDVTIGDDGVPTKLVSGELVLEKQN